MKDRNDLPSNYQEPNTPYCYMDECRKKLSDTDIYDGYEIEVAGERFLICTECGDRQEDMEVEQMTDETIDEMAEFDEGKKWYVVGFCDKNLFELPKWIPIE